MAVVKMNCLFCKRPILWAEIEGKKRKRPLDETPCARGRFVIRNGMSVLLAAKERTTEPRYTTHFQTCPIQRKKHAETALKKKGAKILKAVGPPRKPDPGSPNFKRLTKRK